MERFAQNIYRTLAEDLRLPKGQENLHVTRKDKRKRKKEKRKRKELGWDLHPREGAVKEVRFPYPGKSPHWRGDQPGWKGSLEALSRVQKPDCRRQNGE